MQISLPRPIPHPQFASSSGMKALTLQTRSGIVFKPRNSTARFRTDDVEESGANGLSSLMPPATATPTSGSAHMQGTAPAAGSPASAVTVLPELVLLLLAPALTVFAAAAYSGVFDLDPVSRFLAVSSPMLVLHGIVPAVDVLLGQRPYQKQTNQVSVRREYYIGSLVNDDRWMYLDISAKYRSVDTSKHAKTFRAAIRIKLDSIFNILY